MKAFLGYLRPFGNVTTSKLSLVIMAPQAIASYQNPVQIGYPDRVNARDQFQSKSNFKG